MIKAKRKSIYTEAIDTKNGDLLTLKAFKQSVAHRTFVDSDGHGYPVKAKKLAPTHIVHPSEVRRIPKDATHILWFNK